MFIMSKNVRNIMFLAELEREWKLLFGGGVLRRKQEDDVWRSMSNGGQLDESSQRQPLFILFIHNSYIKLYPISRLTIQNSLYEPSIRCNQNCIAILSCCYTMNSEQEVQIKSEQQPMKSRYVATMLLAAVGDAMGYKQGSWQFNKSGRSIHKDMMRMTDQQGISQLHIQSKTFRYSDDTVMHIATAQGLLESYPDSSLHHICTQIAKYYKSCMKDMGGRAPGATCIRGANALEKNGSNWMGLGFEKNAGGCGASMRAACIGLYFYNNMEMLMQVSIESGRTTHHNPLGYLGSFVAALFTAFAIQDKPPKQWLSLLLQEHLPKAKEYVRQGRDSKQNIQSGDWQKFQDCWRQYAERRKMPLDVPSEPVFPEVYGIEEREEEYLEFSINGWPGALGVDSVIIAYDALLSTLDYCNRQEGKANKWEEVCLRGALHGGDSDSTGTIVGAWYGALYGFQQVFQANMVDSENRVFIESLGAGIYERVYSNKSQSVPFQSKPQNEQ